MNCQLIYIFLQPFLPLTRPVYIKRKSNSDNQSNIDIKKLENRDPHTFRILYDLYKDEVYRLCLTMCGNEDDAKDASQASFINVWKAIRSLRTPDKLHSWIMKIAVNASYEILRKRKNFDENPIDERNSAVDRSDNDINLTREMLIEGLQKLPVKMRTVVILYGLQNLTHEETAAVLGISSGTSKSQFSRGMNILKGFLDIKGLNHE